MKNSLLPLAAAILFLAIFTAVRASSSEIPRVTAPELVQRIESEQDKPVLVVFWATWCGPCLRELPGLMELRGQYSDEELAMLGVSLDFDPRALERFVSKRQVNFHVSLAAEDVLAVFELKNIPKTLVYRNGELVFEHIGYLDTQELRGVIDRFGHRQAPQAGSP